MSSLQDALWGISLFIGGIAAYLDWKSNKIPNKVWTWGLLLASPFLIAELFKTPVAALLRFAFAGIWLALMWLLWRGRAFGGADLKGFALFGLLLSPIGYFNPHDGKFFPALDILVTSILLAEFLRILQKRGKVPLFSVSGLPLLLAPVAGGLAWWPILWILHFFIR